MKRILGCVLLLLPLSLISQSIPSGALPVGSASPLAVFNPHCETLGSGTKTTAAVDTTGAKTIAIVLAQNVGVTPSVADSKSNGNATGLTYYGDPSAQQGVQIFYYLNPTVGTGHTFTVTNASASAICILPISGGLSAYDAATDKGSGVNTTTCQAGSITPPTGQHIVVAAVALTNGSVSSVDSSYTLDGSMAFSGGLAYGVGAAHLTQTPNGSATNPTWTLSGSTGSSCAIASFH
jgi:hypothetical protein